ncbi:MAG: enoyl-CoA hydratase [Rhodospirillaceae bacterium]|nr:enoyl-CoA hydratase [Rhodospirillaceae bacterium]
MTKLKLNTKKMLAEKIDGIGWITFNNPERRNAIGFAMREAILDIIADFERDPGVRVIVMKGAGEKAFVSGSDISEFDKLRSTPEQVKIYDDLSKRVSVAFDNLQIPLIAMIRGFCMGGGLGTALQADLRVATNDSVFGLPAARLGLGYSFLNMKRLVDVIGPAFSKEILFTANRYSAREALSMGLVNKIVKPTELESAVLKIARSIAENAPLTIQTAKLTIEELIKSESERNVGKCQKAIDRCMGSGDYVEGRRAFMEKRNPKFRGR